MFETKPHNGRPLDKASGETECRNPTTGIAACRVCAPRAAKRPKQLLL